jgi:hypothetical protein
MSHHTITLTGEETTKVAHHPAVMDAPKEASLVQIYGPSLGSRYVLDKAEITIGRDASNDIVLGNVNVSRAHARLLVAPTAALSMIRRSRTRNCATATSSGSAQ